MRNSQESLSLKTRRWSWCAIALSTRDWNGTAVAAGAAETVDGGDVTGLGKWSATNIPCIGRGTVRSEGSLEKTHPRKNSVSGSCVEASLVEALCGAARMEVRLHAEWSRAGLSALRRPASSQMCA